jgi:anti-sigma factor RsiW
MTDDRIYQELRAAGWRRKLTGAEEAELRAWLGAHPEAQSDWKAEAGLSEALNGLPDVPVAGNFTARVLQAVQREDAKHRHRQPLWRFWHRWLPRVAFATVLLVAGLISYSRAERAYRRDEIVHSVAALSEVASIPSPEILQHFEAVRVLDQTAPDEELLRLLQ